MAGSSRETSDSIENTIQQKEHPIAMFDQLHSLLRFATPEVFTVVGSLVGLFVGYKAVSWLARTILSVVSRLSFALMSFSAVIIGASSAIGWGTARLNHVEEPPAVAIAAGAATLVIAFYRVLWKFFTS